MSQTTLFDPLPSRLPAYQSASPTSKDAAKAVRKSGKSGRDRETILAWLKGREHGGTQKEASAELGLQRASCCARFAELSGVMRGWPRQIVATIKRREGCAVYQYIACEGE